jgi:hypothetical protein
VSNSGAPLYVSREGWKNLFAMEKWRLYTQSAAYASKHLIGVITTVNEKFLSSARETADAVVDDTA